MDRDQLFELARHWYPIFAAVLSSILNFFSFIIGIQWAANPMLWVSISSLVGTAVFSALVILVLHKLSVSGFPQEFTHLESKDEYCIISSNEVIYKRIVKVKVNKPSSHFVTYPISVDGTRQDYRAYQLDNPDAEHNISIQQIGGRRALFIHLGHYLRKGEILDNLCIECKILNSFREEHEGVSVGTDPGQEHCSIRIVFPEDRLPIAKEADWFTFYGRNPAPLSDGKVQAYHSADNGKYIIDHDFSNHLSKGIGVQCAISWRWKLPVSSSQNAKLAWESAA